MPVFDFKALSASFPCKILDSLSVGSFEGDPKGSYEKHLLDNNPQNFGPGPESWHQRQTKVLFLSFHIRASPLALENPAPVASVGK